MARKSKARVRRVALSITARRRHLLVDVARTRWRLGELGAVQFEIPETAMAMDAGVDTLNQLLRTCVALRMAFGKGRVRSLETLRRAQLDLAATNPSMSMFLGRIYLGQSEQRETGDAEGFDIAGASERIRLKIAAIASAQATSGDRQGACGPG